ncbi:hypothetical protein AD998_07975 [bacterium 336/3]|nr:hypothetical protein AD998_07975 [bacterium 336/3]
MQYLETVKNWLEESEALVISTGAGMGIDAGLADYRGNGGQWGQVETETGQSIFETVNPQAFIENPTFSWGFFAQRIKEYENTQPHEGFDILKEWIEKYHLDYFILTSNIDRMFQKADFDENRIRELHGTLEYFQAVDIEKEGEVWKNEQSGDEILENIAKGVFPVSPKTSLQARPNVYMFRDFTYINTISKKQEERFQAFLQKNKGKKLLVFEIGSGPHVQTVRIKTRMLKTEYGAKIVRINPKDYAIKEPHIGIAKGALEALKEINLYIK